VTQQQQTRLCGTQTVLLSAAATLREVPVPAAADSSVVSCAQTPKASAAASRKSGTSNYGRNFKFQEFQELL